MTNTIAPVWDERFRELQSDLAAARVVQSRLFPVRMPRIAGLDYFGESRPAHEVGGDFFDFIALEGDRLVVSAGDVSGHGVSAAILMSGLQAYLRSLTADGLESVADVVHRLNRTLYDISPDNFFATLFYACVDPSCNMVEYVSAGHEPGLLVRADGEVERLRATGTVLGLCPETHFQRRRLAVRPGDLLVVFTDGITEAADGDGRALCEAGVMEVIRRHREDRASDLAWRIEDAAERHSACQEDDRTVVVVRFTDAAECWPACTRSSHAFAA